ncbi:MAG: leucyl/phenylalanyl-tRNA--protein transferase, partial [Psychroserpens sp.]|nr:leucyl/phenylalanyl-tRNA--protein transferase [Psychroserpens sp.]
MLPYLEPNSDFPHPSHALIEPNGLLAVGGDLSPEMLLRAYSNGIFPWYSNDEPIMWWSPDPRTVFIIDTFKPQKSVKKTIKKHKLRVSLNEDFSGVIKGCSLPRGEETGTWIIPKMLDAYQHLHSLGHAHSVEVWQEHELVGGIYGVFCNNVFCGESMFSKISNGSKIALSCLIAYLQK